VLDVLIITQNEESNLPHCLAALQGWTAGVFVVDSGSTDRTPEIAREMGAEFIHHEWPGYAAQKNWALANLDFRSEWILIIDADEVITPELRVEIEEVLRADPDDIPQKGFHLNRLFMFLGRPIRHCGYFPSWNLRLFRRGTARYEDRSVHEHMVVDGLTGYLDEPMIHDDRRGMEHSIAKHNDYSTLEAKEIMRGREAARLPAAGLESNLFGNTLARRRWFKQKVYHLLPFPWVFRFLYMYIWRRGILDGHAGLRFSLFISAYEFLISLKIREFTLKIQPRESVVPAPDLAKDLPVTVVVPVLNEERNLPACLSRLSRFAKVIVVDSGSTDRTCEIAREFGAEVIDFRWNGQFPKKRNWVLRNHEFDTDWILFLDADEYVNDDFCDELSRALPGSSHDGMWLTYHNHFMGRYMRRGETFTKLALIRRNAGEYERIDEERWSHLDMEVHEHPVLSGTTGRITASIDHDDYKGLDSYIRKHNEYSSWEAKRYMKLIEQGEIAQSHFTRRQRFKYRALRSWWLAPTHFLTSWILRLGFLDGKAGFSFAMLKAVYFFQIRLKIIELELENRSRDRAEG
jgi:glycosyltransferase involved in cell wall biosynthesis